MAAAPSGAAVLATIYTLITLAAIVIAARVVLRLQIQKKTLVWSDWLMILAFCSALATASFDVVMKHHGVLESHINYTLSNYEPENEEHLKYILKMMWAGVIPFFTTFYLCKASLLSVYLQLFPPFMKTRRLVLWLVVGYCAVAYVVSISVQIFLCYPLERNWNIDEPETMCKETVIATVFQICWTLHFIGSIALFLLPFLVIYNLNMRRQMKIGIYCVFMLGLVDIIMSLSRFLVIQLSNVGDFRSITTIELWSVLDAYMGLIIACLPSLRPYLRHGYGASEQYSHSGNRPRAESATQLGGDSQNVFEEIDESSHPGGANPRFTPKTGPLESSSYFTTHDTWNDDRKSDRSDIELVNINVMVLKSQTPNL